MSTWAETIQWDDAPFSLSFLVMVAFYMREKGSLGGFRKKCSISLPEAVQISSVHRGLVPKKEATLPPLEVCEVIFEARPSRGLKEVSIFRARVLNISYVLS